MPRRRAAAGGPAAARGAARAARLAPQLRSRAFVTRRYDQLVQSRTVRRPGLDAAVLRLRPVLPRASRSRSTARVASARSTRSPAALLAILEAARNVACAGGEPLGVHRLPQLRQPGEARDRLGARRVDRGDGAGVRGTRRPDRLGQRLALQRHRRPLDPSDAGRGLRRPRSGRSPRPGTLARGRRDHARAIPLAADARRARRRRRAGGRSAARPSLDLGGRGGADRAHTSRLAAAGSLVHDVSDGGLAVALAEAALCSGHRRHARPRRRPADAVRRGRRPGDRRARPTGQVETDPTRLRRRRPADRRGRRRRASSGSALDELRAAHEGVA